MVYKVCLTKPVAQEDFEKHQNNVATISIQDKKGNFVTDNCNIVLSLSKNAMLGLGKELIREVHREGHSGDMTHFYPARPGEGLVISFGIIIHPESVEPILGNDDFESIDSYTKE